MENHDGAAALRAETLWIESRGGNDWIARYIRPFYMNWMGENPTFRDEAIAQIAELRSHAFELELSDVETMLGMQWRVQVVGAWYAIARADSRLSEAVHSGLAHCYGSLTAPALATAALIYPNDTTVAVLRAYQDRDTANHYGADGLISAALRALDPEPTPDPRTDDDDTMSRLLEIAEALQQPKTMPI